jgi:extradiol dioxygenase family protein
MSNKLPSYPQFHLSIGVNSMEESVDFFVRVLKGKVTHRDPSGYVNVDLYGCELTLKPSHDIKPDLPEFHFGINLDATQFDALAASILESGYEQIVMRPKLVDAGTVIERKKMYLKCPTGYLVELKGYN